MDAIVGPLAEGRTLLAVIVLIGVLVAGAVWTALTMLGVGVPSETVLLVGGVLVGVAVVFAGHVAWHARRSDPEH